MSKSTLSLYVRLYGLMFVNIIVAFVMLCGMSKISIEGSSNRVNICPAVFNLCMYFEIFTIEFTPLSSQYKNQSYSLDNG